MSSALKSRLPAAIAMATLFDGDAMETVAAGELSVVVVSEPDALKFSSGIKFVKLGLTIELSVLELAVASLNVTRPFS